MTQKFWLMKTEPESYSWNDLVGKPGHRDRWEGVRNYQARNFMRDEFVEGQQVFIYHSSTAEPAIVGIARVASIAYPDPTALDPKSPYYDPKSASSGQSRWVMIDVQAIEVFSTAITLKTLRSEPKLQGMALLQRGQRLSIQPVLSEEWAHVCQLGKICRLPGAGDNVCHAFRLPNPPAM